MQMQQLKSVNGIFCDWQFSSRSIIFVPISSADASKIPAAELATRQDMAASHNKALPRTTSDSVIAKDSAASVSSATCTAGKDNLKDYFSKYDTALAEIKDNIEKLEKSMRQVNCIFMHQTGLCSYISGIFILLLKILISGLKALAFQYDAHCNQVAKGIFSHV